MSGSGIYLGRVVHQRHRPKQHRLEYRVFSLLLACRAARVVVPGGPAIYLAALILCLTLAVAFVFLLLIVARHPGD